MSNIRPNNKAISVVEWAISDPITRQSVLDLIPVRHLLILQCDMQNVDIFNVIFKMLTWHSKRPGNVLAPVWLQPDPADQRQQRFIAMKNNDIGDWTRTPYDDSYEGAA